MDYWRSLTSIFYEELITLDCREIITNNKFTIIIYIFSKIFLTIILSFLTLWNYITYYILHIRVLEVNTVSNIESCMLLNSILCT